MVTNNGKHVSVYGRQELKIIISVFLMLVVVMVSFLPSLKNSFTNWDDEFYISQNPDVKNLSLKGIAKLFTTTKLGLYTPLVSISFALEYHFFKLDPAAYHTTNLILHLMNCLLVFMFIFILSNNNLAISFIVSLLFGVHPLRVESVAWISERKDMLYALFFLGALIFYFRYLKKEARKSYYYSLALSFVSLLSKPMGVSLPFVMCLCDYFLGVKCSRRNFIEKIPFFIIAIVFSVIAASKNLHSYEPFKLSSHIPIVNFRLIFYLYKIFVPINLSCLYPDPLVTVNSFPVIFWLSSLIVMFLGAIAILSRKYNRNLIFGISFFVITILPVLKLIPLGSGRIEERFTYIPSIGIFYIVAAGIFWIYTNRLKLRILGVMVLIILISVVASLSFLTWQRCKVWKDSLSLWNDVLSHYPDLAIAYNNRGNIFLGKKEYDKAYADFKKAIEVDPLFPYTYNNLGIAYSDAGRKEDAIAMFEKAIIIDPNFAKAYYNLGNVYNSIGDENKAITWYEKAIGINPDFLEAYYNLGSVYNSLKDRGKAIRIFKKLREISPSYLPAYLNLSDLYKSADQKEELTGLYKQAIANNLDYFEAYYNIGDLYSNLGQEREAIALYKRAIDINPNSAPVYTNLGSSYCAIGKNKQAIILLKKAIQLDPKLAVAHNNLAVAYYYERQYDLAIKHCDKAIELGYEVSPKFLELLEPHRR